MVMQEMVSAFLPTSIPHTGLTRTTTTKTVRAKDIHTLTNLPLMYNIVDFCNSLV